MPALNKEYRDRHHRDYQRTKLHGNWRQIVINYHGLCAGCGQPIIDDLHEPFGESKDKFNVPGTNGKFQQRVPLCIDCHQREHIRSIIPNRLWVGKYLDDISIEIRECGSLGAWNLKYGVVESTLKELSFPYEPALDTSTPSWYD